MKILFTGASSFTGFWFINELIKNGHEVLVLFTKLSISEYVGIQRIRIEELLKLPVKPFWGVKFGTLKFIKLLKKVDKIDMFCNHGAFLVDYQNANFDLVGALKENTKNVQLILKTLKNVGCSKILITGTYYEPNEGLGSKYGSNAFSIYGLSKKFTYDIFNYYSTFEKIDVGKFIVPNPFGPYENKGLTFYLFNNWLKNKKPKLNNPYVIRDFVHVDLLAKSFAKFCEDFFNNKRLRFAPSGYVTSVINFTDRLITEIEKRKEKKFVYEITDSVIGDEPLIRYNSDPAIEYNCDWKESESWDNLINYYFNIKLNC